MKLHSCREGDFSSKRKVPHWKSVNTRAFWRTNRCDHPYSALDECVGLFATLENSVFLTPKIRSCARENLLRSSALSLASRVLAACERFQLPRSSLKRSKRKHALCRQFAGLA